MCLEKVTNWCKEKKGIGWKVVLEDREHKYHPQFQNRFLTFKKCHWNKDTNLFRITSAFYVSSQYSSGFHLFKTRAEAREWTKRKRGIIKKVKYRKLVASGIQSYKRVIVAKEFKFL